MAAHHQVIFDSILHNIDIENFDIFLRFLLVSADTLDFVYHV